VCQSDGSERAHDDRVRVQRFLKGATAMQKHLIVVAHPVEDSFTMSVTRA